ncbi:MAG: ribosome small subunit-dependent GTPase A [Alphaproteobacteria bacterium]|nr:ribosome small subunit-dependent GTPase A [Alphaproteobacteria bacterium]
MTLKDLGWHPHFEAQLSETERVEARAVRVMAVHRDALEVAGPSFEGRVPPLIEDEEALATVGDWFLIERHAPRALRVLEPRSVFKRKSAGTGRRVQLIAANVDTLLLVTSANQDFNPARLERYLALAAEAEVTPVVVITKADMAADAADYAVAARKLMPGLLVEALDARSGEAARVLAPWIGRGQTLALLGSSGVGKSTLVNSLSGHTLQATHGIREDDAKGRHTTTGRSLHRLASGAWLMDTPGMRELQLIDAASGIDEVFEDVAQLMTQCRFSDCTHGNEPGCAVQGALSSGALDADRLKRYRKLLREERHNSESIAESRARSRKFGKMAKGVFAEKLRQRGF